MDYERAVEIVEEMIRGWIGNIMRDAEGANVYYGEAVFAQALENILNDLDGSIENDVDSFINDVLDRSD